MKQMTAKRKKVKAVEQYSWDEFSETWEIPRTAEAYDQMVEQIANSVNFHECFIGETGAKNALRAIGITRPKEDGK